MEALDTKDFARDFFNVDGEDLLNFTLDVEVDESNKENINLFKPSSSSVISSVTSTVANGGSSPLPADEEEDLEWLSNKDAFPAVEFDIINNTTEMGILGQHSPVSVLENVVINEKRIHNQGIIQLLPCGFPYFARKKRISRKRRIGFGHNKHLLLVGHEITVVNVRNYSQEPPPTPPPKMVKRYNRSCLHCGSDTTPQWRAGPKGPKTLCNACGVRYNSGRLVPEYRPACSPTFSAGMHSNSHRKIVEMRKLKQVGGMVVVKGTF